LRNRLKKRANQWMLGSTVGPKTSSWYFIIQEFTEGREGGREEGKKEGGKDGWEEGRDGWSEEGGMGVRGGWRKKGMEGGREKRMERWDGGREGKDGERDGGRKERRAAHQTCHQVRISFLS